jgi:tetratricopeptide (TPR) repeat protein
MRTNPVYVSTFAALMWMTCSIVAEAQQDDVLSACLGRGGVTADQRIEACSSIIESGKATNENLALAYGNRGVARLRKKEFEGARGDHRESLRLDSTSGASHRFRGNLYLFDGNEMKASEEYRQAIKVDPKLGPAYTSLGMLAFRRGAGASAIEFLDKAIEFEPDELMNYLVRGQAKIETEAYDQAIADFNVAIKDPEPADAFFGRGSAFAHKGEHKKALADYDEGIRLKNDRGDSFAIRCAIRAVLGHPFDEVMDDCDRALSLPNGLITRAMRGFALLKLGHPDRALKEFDIALRSMPRPAPPRMSEAQANLLFGIGLAKRRLGDMQESAKDLELSAKLSSRAKRRASVFYGIED